MKEKTGKNKMVVYNEKEQKKHVESTRNCLHFFRYV